jgi:predicted ATPase
VKARLDKLETLLARSGEIRAESVGLLAELLGLSGEGRYPPLPQDPQRRRDMILTALLGEFEGLAQRHPVLLIFEDAQWADSTSLELLDRAVERATRLPVLMIVTFRPEFTPPWTGLAHVASLSLNRLAQREAATLVAGIIGGDSLPLVMLNRIVERTDGIPLFIEELTKGLLEGDLVHEDRDGSAPTDRPAALVIPSSLQDSLMARLDRLNAAKRVAQLAAIIGREFSYELLHTIAPISADELGRALRQLVESGLIFQRGEPPRARYMFKHALIQDAAYQSLLRAQRREQHKRVAETLEQQYAETAETQPELIAHHYTEAGLAEPAIIYWRRAGERAVKQAANLEAINHLRRGLELLEALPARVTLAEEELRIRIALGPALMTTMTTSAPEIRQVYGRAQQLARDTGKIPDLFATVWGSYYVGLATENVASARSLTDELFSIARSQDDPGLLLQAHHAAWPLELTFGDLNLAHKHTEAGLNLYRQETHGQQAMLYGGHDPAVCGYTLGALVSQILGYPDRASMQLEKGLALARRLAHPPSLMHALWMGAEMRFVRSDPTNTASLVAEYLSLVSDYSTSVAASNARTLRGWAMVMTGDRDAGLIELRDGLDRWRGTRANLWAPYRLGRAAAVFLEAGEIDAGTTLLSDALQAVEVGGERWYEAELYRLKGELLLVSSVEAQAEAQACLQRALTIAHAQGARLFELRAAMALGRLQCDRDERKCRKALLGSVFDSFVEGFDTPELKEARALLDELE